MARRLYRVAPPRETTPEPTQPWARCRECGCQVAPATDHQCAPLIQPDCITRLKGQVSCRCADGPFTSASVDADDVAIWPCSLCDTVHVARLSTKAASLIYTPVQLRPQLPPIPGSARWI